MSQHSCVVYLNQGHRKLFLVTQNTLVAVVGLGRGIAGAFGALSLAYGHSASHYCAHNVFDWGCLHLASLVVSLFLVLVESQEYSLSLLHNYPLVHHAFRSPFSLH